jgi:hypothetical protein
MLVALIVLCPLREKLIISVCYALFYCLPISLTDLAKFGSNTHARGKVAGFTVTSFCLS